MEKTWKTGYRAEAQEFSLFATQYFNMIARNDSKHIKYWQIFKPHDIKDSKSLMTCTTGMYGRLSKLRYMSGLGSQEKSWAYSKSCMLCMWLNTMQYFCKNYRQAANIVNRSVEATFTEDFAKY